MKSLLRRNAVWLGALAGAIIGAVLLPVVQAAETFAYIAWVLMPSVPRAMPFTPLQETLSFMRDFGKWFALIGALLGIWSALTLVSWHQRDVQRARRAAVFDTCTAVGLCVASPLFAREIVSAPWTVWLALFFLAANAPLQWSIALAIAGRIAANRLQHEAKRDAKAVE